MGLTYIVPSVKERKKGIVRKFEKKNDPCKFSKFHKKPQTHRSKEAQ